MIRASIVLALLIPLNCLADGKTARRCFHSEKVKVLQAQVVLPETSAQIQGQLILTSESFHREIVYVLSNGQQLGCHHLKRIFSAKQQKVIQQISFCKRDGNLATEETNTILGADSLPVLQFREEKAFDDKCQGRRTAIHRKDNFDSRSNPGSMIAGDFPLVDPLDIIKDNQSKSVPFYSINDQGYEGVFDLTPISPFSFADLVTTERKSFRGVQIQMRNFPFRIQRFKSLIDNREITLLFANEAINRKVEEISKQTWMNGELDNEVQILDLRHEDFFRPSITIRIQGTGRIPLIRNSDKYFDMKSSQNRDSWFGLVHFEPKVPPPSVPINQPLTDDEKLNVRDSTFLQIAQVQEIANQIRSRVGSANRMAVVQEVLKEVQKRLKYNDKTKTLPRTEDILNSGDGICYHFSILFAAIARASGLPTKIIGGSVVLGHILGAHAWNEVLIAPNVWWPIEPQTPHGEMFQHGYIPDTEMTGQELQKVSMGQLQSWLSESVLSTPYGIQSIEKP